MPPSGGASVSVFGMSAIPPALGTGDATPHEAAT
jgi:hypothetical protein